MAAGAEPVTVPTSADTARTPRATTVGRSPPNSTILRTSVPAIPVSSRSLPSQEPRMIAIMVAARVGAPSWRTVSSTLSLPVSGAPARKAMTTASSTSAKAVGSLRVSIRPTCGGHDEEDDDTHGSVLSSGPGQRRAQRGGEEQGAAAEPADGSGVGVGGDFFGTGDMTGHAEASETQHGVAECLPERALRRAVVEVGVHGLVGERGRAHRARRVPDTPATGLDQLPRRVRACRCRARPSGAVTCSGRAASASGRRPARSRARWTGRGRAGIRTRLLCGPIGAAARGRGPHGWVWRPAAGRPIRRRRRPWDPSTPPLMRLVRMRS